MYLSSQLFFKTTQKLYNFKKNLRKIHFPAICRPKVQKYFPSVSNMGPTNGATELRKQSRN